MIQGERKLARIIEALTMFFFGLGADHIQSDIALSGDQAVIRFRANYQKEYRQQLCRLEDASTSQRTGELKIFTGKWREAETRARTVSCFWWE